MQYQNSKFMMYSNQATLSGRCLLTRQYNAHEREITTEIIFGTPGKNCEGHGICRMLSMSILGDKKIMCPHATGYLALDLAENTLLLRMPKIHLTSQMVARHFYKRLFKVTESYRVPARFTRALGTQQKYTIREGVYAVMETRTDWIVVFDQPGVL